MEPYIIASQASSRAVMTAYSTSFGTASRLFPQPIRQQIYDVYGLVRLADEIVDTYTGLDRAQLLDQLEQETYEALKRGYSPNILIQAFIGTAAAVHLGKDLITPFFDSMRMDLTPAEYKSADYGRYIYGSAEVIGLMCLKVFAQANDNQYEDLRPGAQALGAAFQKINFLRDMAADYKKLGRYYFPVDSYQTFTGSTKAQIIADIKADLAVADVALAKLPRPVRLPVTTAANYYQELLTILEAMPASELKKVRPRISDSRKLQILAQTWIRQSLQGDRKK